MGFIGAGLLSGLGAGVTELATQKREDALNALRRQYQLTDAATASAEAEKNDRRDAANKLDQLYLAGSMKQRENESDQAFEMRKAEFVAAQETGHITQRGTIETGQIAQRAKNDMALEKYKAAEAKGLVDRVEVQTDGTPVIIYKGGRREVAPDLNIRETGRSTDSDSGGLIEAARNRGKPPTTTRGPAATRKTNPDLALPIMNSDADAQAFVNNPVNKGKQFIGNDGKLYRAGR